MRSYVGEGMTWLSGNEVVHILWERPAHTESREVFAVKLKAILEGIGLY